MFNIDVQPFLAHPLLRSGNAQTLFAATWHGSNPIVGTLRHFVDLPDGDRIAVHEDFPSTWKSGDRQVLMLHGLGGCHGSSYMVRIASRLKQAGSRVWRMDARGCGAGVATARRHHHAGRSEDIHVALKYILKQSGNSPASVVGFSLGANVLLNWLSTEGRDENCNVDSAIAVAPPADLTLCGNNLNRGLSRGYDAFFGRLMRDRFVERRSKVVDLLDVSINPLPRKLVQFDDRVTAPLNGFTNVRDYYQQCSSVTKLAQIEIPTLIVADQHDPVIPYDIFRNLCLPQQVQIMTTQFGGHLGYVAAASTDLDCRWLDWRLVDWISGLTLPVRKRAGNL